MGIKFHPCEELEKQTGEIARILGMNHIDLTRVKFVVSSGSKAKRTIARCYALSKIWQKALDMRAHYIIEVISENYDKLPEEEKEKVLIHELMHIPFSMGGGFKHHSNYVTREHVNLMHKRYSKSKSL